jgi:hypothetical protein
MVVYAGSGAVIKCIFMTLEWQGIIFEFLISLYDMPSLFENTDELWSFVL